MLEGKARWILIESTLLPYQAEIVLEWILTESPSEEILHVMLVVQVKHEPLQAIEGHD